MEIYRVECNFGCRYFKEIEKACRYFDKCHSKRLNVELWVVNYFYCPLLDKYTAVQELVAYSTTYLPKN